MLRDGSYCWVTILGQVGNGVAKPVLSDDRFVRDPLGTAETFSKIARGTITPVRSITPGAAYCRGQIRRISSGIRRDRPNIHPTLVHPGVATHSRSLPDADTPVDSASDGVALCWGDNGRGQLGRGTYGDSIDVPAPVPSSVAFTSARRAGRFASGLSTAGAIYCWGDDRTRQYGARVGRQRAYTESDRTGYAAVSAGWRRVCALNAGGAACWRVRKSETDAIGGGPLCPAL